MAHNQSPTAIIIVDHGSKFTESNTALEDIAMQFQHQSPYNIVEPAHMDIATPTIADAFNRCARQGAAHIIIFPFFLLPGRHVAEDIPRLVSQAAKLNRDITYLITNPIAPHPLINQIIQSRIDNTYT